MRSKLLNLAMTIALTVTAFPALGVTTASACGNYLTCFGPPSSNSNNGGNSRNNYGNNNYNNRYERRDNHREYRDRRSYREDRPRYHDDRPRYREDRRRRHRDYWEHSDNKDNKDNNKNDALLLGLAGLGTGLIVGTLLNQPDRTYE